MSIIWNKEDKWTGLCKQTDCIHNLGNQFPELSSKDEGYNCTLDKIHINSNLKCADYKTKLINILESLEQEFQKMGVTNKVKIIINLNTHNIIIGYRTLKNTDINLDNWR